MARPDLLKRVDVIVKAFLKMPDKKLEKGIKKIAPEKAF